MNVQNEANNMIDAKLLELLVCPVTKGKLKYDREKGHLISKQAKLIFPIIDGVPHMSLETALLLEDENGRRIQDSESSSEGE